MTKHYADSASKILKTYPQNQKHDFLSHLKFKINLSQSVCYLTLNI